jgi:hypothetical protein
MQKKRYGFLHEDATCNQKSFRVGVPGAAFRGLAYYQAQNAKRQTSDAALPSHKLRSELEHFAQHCATVLAAHEFVEHRIWRLRVCLVGASG